MTTELRVNGLLILRLKPETVIETTVLTEMADGAARGKKVSLTIEDGVISVAVEKG